MKKFLFAATALLVAAGTPAAAQDVENREFTRDGVTYRYDVIQHDGYRVLQGRATPGSNFRLVVRGDRVTGRVNNRPVSFSTDMLQASAPATSVASL